MMLKRLNSSHDIWKRKNILGWKLIYEAIERSEIFTCFTARLMIERRRAQWLSQFRFSFNFIDSTEVDRKMHFIFARDFKLFLL